MVDNLTRKLSKFIFAMKNKLIMAKFGLSVSDFGSTMGIKLRRVKLR